MSAPPKSTKAAECVQHPTALTTDNPADIIQPESEQGKRIATLKAAFALCGHAVHELADGGFLVCKFNLSRHCPDLRSLVAFARQTGVQA